MVSLIDDVTEIIIVLRVAINFQATSHTPLKPTTFSKLTPTRSTPMLPQARLSEQVEV